MMILRAEEVLKEILMRMLRVLLAVAVVAATGVATIVLADEYEPPGGWPACAPDR